MSGRLLGKGGGVHSTQDDRESAYWVLLYTGLRYLRHNLEAGPLRLMISNLFDSQVATKGGDVGGTEKTTHLGYSNRLDKLSFEVAHVNDMFNELANTLRTPYIPLPTSEEIELYERDLKHFGEAEALRTTAGKYYAAVKNIADPAWFIATLRKYADRIPLRLDQYDYFPHELSDPTLSARLEKVGNDREYSARAQFMDGMQMSSKRPLEEFIEEVEEVEQEHADEEKPEEQPTRSTRSKRRKVD